MSHIFISYNREDQYRARVIADGLEAEGLKVWWDTNLRAGESYDEVTEKNLREAGAVVVLWSKRSSNSKWVRAEATVGERFSKLVPAMIEECERPLRFELVQTADLISWHGDRSSQSWREFIHDIKLALGHDTQPSVGDGIAAGAAPAGGAVNAAGGASPDITIENTFWNSIKDGNDKAEFEAYLNRYPDGHFTDLAHARLAVIQRAAEAKKAPPPPVQPIPASPSSAQTTASPQHRPTRPSPQQQRPTQQAQARQTQAPQHAARQAVAKDEKSGMGMWIAVALGALVVGLGAVVAIQMQRGEDPVQTAASEAPTERVNNAAPLSTSSAESSSENDATSQVSSSPEDNNDVSPAADNAIDESVQVSTDTPADSPISATPSTTSGDVIADIPEETTADEADGTALTGQNQSAGDGDPANDVYSDCEQCPEMKILPAGRFTMGSPSSEPGHLAYEGPQHDVTLNGFAIGMHEVTHDQWAACIVDGGCGGYTPSDGGFGAGAMPVLSVSWNDATAYVQWLSSKTGRSYRLPSEAEWEYAARGGSETAYWWGERFDRSKAALGKTVETGSLDANGFGLYEVAGNVSEWVQDCYVNNFSSTPVDGSPMTGGDCSRRVIRGGSWRSEPDGLRSANRSRVTRSTRDRRFGFRVAADVE